MSQVENLKIGNVTYGITDSNTLPALTNTQRTTLLANGTYLGEVVENNKVFETVDGKFEKFIKTVTGSTIGNEGTLTFPETTLSLAHNNTNTIVGVSKSTGKGYCSKDDGATWTEITFADSFIADSIAYSDRYFVITGGVYTNKWSSIYSTDGLNWTSGGTLGSNYYPNYRYRVYGGLEDTFIASQGSNYGNALYISKNHGITWTAINQYKPSNLDSACFDDENNFIYCYNQSVYKFNTTTMTNTKLSDYPLYFYVPNIRCGNGYTVIMEAGNNSNYGAYSTDGGTTWTIASKSGGGYESRNMVYGNGLFLGIQDSAGRPYLVVFDGTRWYEKSMPAYSRINGIFYKDKFIIQRSGSTTADTLDIVSTYAYALSPLSYTASEVDIALADKQGTLTAGTNITIDSNNVISATGGEGINYAGGTGITVTEKTYSGVLLKNTEMTDENVIICQKSLNAGLILPDKITKLNNKDITTFNFYVKAFIPGSNSYTYGDRLISLFGDAIWTAHGQSQVKDGGCYGGPVFLVNTSAWFKISKTAEGKIIMSYKTAEGAQWTTLISTENDFSTTDWQGEWALGCARGMSTQKLVRFYLQDCYLEVDGTEVWRGTEACDPEKVIAIDNTVLTNDVSDPGNLYAGLAIKSKHCSGNFTTAIGQNTEVSGTCITAVGYGAKATGFSSTAIGYFSKTDAIAETVIGAGASATKPSGIALGYYASSTAVGAIQLGSGINSSRGTLSVALTTNERDIYNYQLLKSSGKIPVERLAEIIITGPEDPTTETEGTLGLLYKNTTNGKIFRCSKIEDASDSYSGESNESYSGTVYTWSELIDASNVYTKEEIDTLLEFIVGDIETRLSRV